MSLKKTYSVKPGEQVDREIRNALSRPQELAEHDVVHQELDERPDDGPEEAQEAVAIPGLQVAADEKAQQLSA